MDEKTIARFWNKVDKNGPVSPFAPELGSCWRWTSGIDNRGNGKFWANKASHRAHRFSWELSRGRLAPAGYVVQVCGNPLCVRPEHLSDNPRDRRKKIHRSTYSCIEHDCPVCGASFMVKRSHARRGSGKFCSKSCIKLHASRVSSDLKIIADRFWSKVNKNGPTPAHVPSIGRCWLWTGRLQGGSGYGQFWHLGKSVAAHRFSYELTFGTILGHMNACHKCDNPACVRPDHIFQGTTRDNIADRDNKHRTARGVEIGTSRLTEDGVRRIFALSKQGLTQRQIAAEVRLSDSTVSYVLSGFRWSHLGLATKRTVTDASRAGSKNGRAQLSEEAVITILTLLARGVSRAAIAMQFGVSYGIVSKIATGITWRHLSQNPKAKPLALPH